MSRYDACVEINPQGGSGTNKIEVELDASNGRMAHLNSGIVLKPTEVLTVRHDHTSTNQITISGYLVDL